VGGPGRSGGDWGEQYRLLAARDGEQELDVDDLDRLATAAYMTGRDDEGFAVWARAHQRCLENGQVARAAMFGVRLAQGLAFKGDIARSSGWVERSDRILLDANLDCVERGFLEHAAGMCRIFADGDIAAAHAAFGRAAKIGERFRDRELLTFARMGEGRCLIYLGEIAEGLALLDEVMVSVEACEIPPMAIGDAYCTVIDACHELFDLRRCEQWTDSFTRWCDAQAGLVLYRGHCLMHRAELLILHGNWSEGVAAAMEACARLAQPVNTLTLGGAQYVEGELHRLRGEYVMAEQAYERANAFGCQPQPGMALLRLAQGRVEVAAAQLRRLLAETEGPIARARVLCPAAEILLAASDVDGARSAADELTSLATVLGSPLLRAHAALANGSVCLTTGDPTTALVSLRRAARHWGEMNVPYEGARTRMLIADACEALADRDGAELERRAARATFDALGAGVARPDRTVRQERVDVTSREAEVLILVARGKSNRAIAAELCISEKTVASHLNHIFTKLGLTSRTAATAYAYEHDLVS
jgi:DNA-binding CsgD family transcriptional regulator/tetratricopeptide (TPR) repeat protein